MGRTIAHDIDSIAHDIVLSVHCLVFQLSFLQKGEEL